MLSSDNLLSALAAAADLENVMWTSLLCYQVRTPSNEHFDMCRSRLEEDIAKGRPQVVFLLGKTVTEYLLDVPFGPARACAYWKEDWNCWVIPTWDTWLPVYTNNDDMVLDLLRDFKKAPLYINRPQNYGDVEYQVVAQADQAAAILQQLPNEVLYALDVETSRETNTLACLAISDGLEDTWVFTREAITGIPKEVWESVATRVKWCFHNSLFDTRMIRRNLGVWLRITEDSLLQSYSLDNRSGGEGEDQSFVQGIHGLKRLAAEYESAGVYNIKVSEAIKKDQMAKLYDYNAHDAAYTARLSNRFRVWQEEEGVRNLYLKMMIPAVNILAELQEQGIPISKTALGELARKWGAEYLELDADLEATAYEMGWPKDRAPLNPRSPKQLCEFLYDIVGEKLTKLGRTTQEKAIVGMDNPYIKKLLQMRHLNKMLSTYIIGIEREMDANDRIHPSPKMHGTRTGRFSYVDPAVQTVPSEHGREGGEEFGKLRGLFKAPEGSLVWAADYEQAELWSMAMQSGDKVMLDDLMSGDFHSNATAEMFQIKREDYSDVAWSQLRFKSKFVTFGVAFGRSALSLSEEQLKGYTVRQCQAFIDRWYLRYNVFAEWVARQKKLIVTSGVQWTPSGRRFFYPTTLNADNFRKCVNYMVQGFSHDHLLEAMINLHPKLREYNAWIWMDVHDALVGEVPGEYVEEVSKLVVEEMQKPKFGMPFGIPVELKVGTTWLNAKNVYSKGVWTL